MPNLPNFCLLCTLMDFIKFTEGKKEEEENQ